MDEAVLRRFCAGGDGVAGAAERSRVCTPAKTWGSAEGRPAARQMCLIAAPAQEGSVPSSAAVGGGGGGTSRLGGLRFLCALRVELGDGCVYVCARALVVAAVVAVDVDAGMRGRDVAEARSALSRYWYNFLYTRGGHGGRASILGRFRRCLRLFPVGRVLVLAVVFQVRNDVVGGAAAVGAS